MKTLSKKLEALLQTLDNEDCLELFEQGDFESSDGGFATVFVDKTRLGQHFAGVPTPVYRRKYSVPTPNALWHIDGNHKLTRYRFVVHCCVDGYSRVIVYATLTDNNRADTVLELFIKGVQEFGLPSRVRSDHGLENVGVAQYMLENRGLDRGSIITGSSVHNCRVERAHRDVYAGVLCHFANIFSGMEDMGLLDPLNEVHLFSLHFVYTPRINRALQHFTGQWNNHRLR